MAALSEWVISVHFQERNNIAADYIQAIQNNPAKLKAANKVIQKYNLALNYVQENNADLAIIELQTCCEHESYIYQSLSAAGAALYAEKAVCGGQKGTDACRQG